MLDSEINKGIYSVPEKPKHEEEIEIVTEYDNNYRIVPANYYMVAWTGLGDMRIDFMIQHLPLPERVTHALDGLNIGNELKRDPAGARLERIAQVGVLLSIEQAQVLSDLIKTQIENYKKSTKGK